MKVLKFLALTLIFVLSVTQLSGQVDPEKLPAEVYRHNPDLKLYFAYPEGKQGKLPTIVFFFGGGWRTGSVTAFARQAEYFSQRGILVVLADYRINSKHQTTPFESVQDAKSAMRYVKAHAGRLRVDTIRLAAGGGSAGGHLAACTAFCPENDSSDDDLSISPVPKALVLYNPVVDFSLFQNRLENMQIGDRHLTISPYHHIVKGAPPTLIMHGTDDATVPAWTVEAFSKKMTEMDNYCVLKLYEGYGHGFFNYRDNNPTPYNLTIKDADDFLTSLGFIEK